MAETGGKSYDESLVNDVLAHADIVSVISSYLDVQQKGRNYMALCPFHDDTTPSLSISKEKQIYKCFVCGEGGSAITFVMKYEKIPFMDAVRKVAELSGYYDERLERKAVHKQVDEEKEALYKCLEDLTLYYQLALKSEEGVEASEYLARRGIDEEIISKYRIGYAPIDGANTCHFLQQKGHSLKSMDDLGISSMLGGNPVDKNRGRIIFPICDRDGRVVGYSARSLGKSEEAKYINTSETPVFHKSSLLYNYHNAYQSARLDGYVYLVEGFMDAIALEKVGIKSVVALMGTALTKEHIGLLRQLKSEVRVCLDGDQAGLDASLKMSSALNRAGIPYRIVSRGGDQRDLDEILSQDGNDALLAVTTNLKSRLDFAVEYYESTNTLQTVEDRRKLIEYFLPLIDEINDSMEKGSYIDKLSKITGFTGKSITERAEAYHKEKHSAARPSANMTNYLTDDKDVRRLILTEKEFAYQMLHSKDAIDFYSENNMHFYKKIHRDIAEFLVDYASTHSDVDYNGIINFIYLSDQLSDDEKEKLKSDIDSIYYDKGHNNHCTKELLKDLKATIDKEMDSVHTQDVLRQAIMGKSSDETARIYSDYQRNRKIDKDKK
ncbi:MAG: DNA primase [Coprobacillus sp.]|nr:DNA primase [Coprobacillus sp.]